MLRLQGMRANRAQRDPMRAFQRLRDNLAALRAARDVARQNLLGNLVTAGSRAAMLRTAYDSFRECGLRAVSSASGGGSPAVESPASSCAADVKSIAAIPAASSEEQIQREVAAVTGQDGLVRVCNVLCCSKVYDFRVLLRLLWRTLTNSAHLSDFRASVCDGSIVC